MVNKKKDMSQMTFEERVARSRAEARDRIAKREKLGIRFTEGEIVRIQKMAEKLDIKVMPMLHAWILKCLAESESGVFNESFDHQNDLSEPARSRHELVVDNKVASTTSQTDAALDRALDTTLRDLASLLDRCGYLERPGDLQSDISP